MPFITPEKRKLVDSDVRLAEDKGDLCYYFYKKMIEAWKAERRWTTAHNLYKDMVLNLDHLIILKETKYTRADQITALHLAWQVFFALHVCDYENEKQFENGDID